MPSFMYVYVGPVYYKREHKSLHCVSKNVPRLTCYTRSDYDNFLQKCYEESKKSGDALFSHLTYLVVLHYLAKQETQKLRLFT